ncbi:MAG: CehA/McbA family metallohydrolase [Acidobacteria bacterium]|nr:CehA/McbA family metallohydrolase [Acidobacteriota bacterium]
MSRAIALLLACGVGVCAAVSANVSEQTEALRWYKGNTHTHTLNSDGDSTPDEVVQWYRENGYNFLVLTDHNFLTTVDGLNALHGADGQFLALKGEEVTARFEGKPLHVNGLNVNRLVDPQTGSSIVDVLQRTVSAIRDAGGIPHINHPNFGWAITADELKQVRNDRLLEIYNGHPFVNNAGGGGVPGTEDVWDAVLSSGKLVFGIAVDDAHHFKRPWDPGAAKPGKGWVMVRAATLSVESILSALERGEFYASTGVELDSVVATERSLNISVKQVPSSKYRIQFIGRNGRMLAEFTSSPASYSLRGNEGYVRARILESNGLMAWTQPVVKN